MIVQVIGCGTVGEAVAKAAEGRGHHVYRYDPGKNYAAVMDIADLALICVPTPSDQDGSCNLDAVLETTDRLVRHGFTCPVGIRSTVPPTTCEWIRQQTELAVFSWPEFLRAETAEEQCEHPAYHVWGVHEDDRATVLPLLQDFVAGGAEAPILLLSPTSAEFLKYASNVLLASQVAVANQLHDVAEVCGVEWDELGRQYPAVEPLVGDTLHVTEERGFGGACLPKDLAALIKFAEARDVQVEVLRAVRDYNERIRKPKGQVFEEDVTLTIRGQVRGDSG